MKKSSFITSILGTALLLIPLSLFAQDDERASLSDVWYVMPKAGMVAEFEAAAKAHIAFRRDAGDSRDWESFSAALGSNPQLYQWREGGLTWADMDAYIAEDTKNGYSEHWWANVDQYVDHYHHYVEQADYENSHWPADLPQRPYYGVTTWKISSDAEMAANEALKELSKIALEEGWADMDGNTWLWQSRIGGSGALMIVSELENFAAMEPPEQSFFEFLSEKRSAEEAAELFAAFGAGYKDSSFTVWAHRPDLSSQETAGSDD
jgi:hypothetical protein